MPSEPEVQRPRRRSYDEIHRLLVDAAAEAFVEKGYTGTTTKEIGLRAGVSEVMLFRHFGSKARLFSEASLQPFNDFLARFAADWGAHVDEQSLDEPYLREFVAGLYDLSRERRTLIVDLLASAAYEPELLAGDEPLLRALTDVAAVGQKAMARRGVDDVDSAMTARAIITMVVATAVLGPVLFGHDPGPDGRDAVIDDLARMAGRLIGPPRNR